MIDQGLIRTWIDLREQVAGVHGLAFGEVDAHDLPLDLGAHDVGVVRNHRADTSEIDRHVVLGDHPSDDRHRGCRSWCGSGFLQQASMHEVQQAGARKHHSQQDRDKNFPFHGALI